MFSSNSHDKERMRIKTKTTIVCLQPVSSGRQNAFSLVTTYLVLSNAALIRCEVHCPELRRKPCVFRDGMERLSVSERTFQTWHKRWEKEGKCPRKTSCLSSPPKPTALEKAFPFQWRLKTCVLALFMEALLFSVDFFHGSKGLFLKEKGVIVLCDPLNFWIRTHFKSESDKPFLGLFQRSYDLVVVTLPSNRNSSLFCKWGLSTMSNWLDMNWYMRWKNKILDKA